MNQEQIHRVSQSVYMLVACVPTWSLGANNKIVITFQGVDGTNVETYDDCFDASMRFIDLGEVWTESARKMIEAFILFADNSSTEDLGTLKTISGLGNLLTTTGNVLRQQTDSLVKYVLENTASPAIMVVINEDNDDVRRN